MNRGQNTVLTEDPMYKQPPIFFTTIANVTTIVYITVFQLSLMFVLIQATDPEDERLFFFSRTGYLYKVLCDWRVIL